MKTNVKKLENSQVEIEVTLPYEILESYRDEVTESFLKNVEIDGFRKGKVPEEMALKKMDAMHILEEMAQRAISKSYVDILHKESIKAIGHPQIVITKIAEGAALEFKITTAVLPHIELSDYKKIAKKENAKEYPLEVPETEVDQAIDNLRKMHAQQEQAKNLKPGEEPASWKDINEDQLPQLNDEWVATLGKFTTVAEFKEKIRENLEKEKEAKNFEKKRITLIEAILKEGTIEVPDMIVEYEIDKMLHELEGNIAMTGMSFDDYLTSIKKTRESYRDELRGKAKERAQAELMLNHIAAEEKLEPDTQDIEREVSKIMEQYKNQKGIDENNVRAYVANILTHQKVFEFLDAQK